MKKINKILLLFKYRYANGFLIVTLKKRFRCEQTVSFSTFYNKIKCFDLIFEGMGWWVTITNIMVEIIFIIQFIHPGGSSYWFHNYLINGNIEKKFINTKPF